MNGVTIGLSVFFLVLLPIIIVTLLSFAADWFDSIKLHDVVIKVIYFISFIWLILVIVISVLIWIKIDVRSIPLGFNI